MDNETSAIDNKKNQQNNSSDDTSFNLGGFFKNLISVIIQLIIWLWVIGPIVLYTSKMAAAGVLPTDLSEIPYSDSIKNVANKIINVNVIKEADKIYSTKVNLNHKEILEQMNNGLFSHLKDFQTNPKKANYFGNFWANIMFNILSTNFDLFDKVYSKINSNFPESLTILISPIIFWVFIICLYFINLVQTFIYQISTGKDFFSKMKIENNKVVWEEGNFLEPIRWIFAILSMIFIFWPATFLLPIFTLCYSMFTPLFISGKLENNKKYNFFNFLIDNIYYKSQLFLIMFSLLIISPIYSNLGTYYLIAFFIAIAILAFKHFYDYKSIAQDPHVSEGLEKPNVNMKGGFKKKYNKKK